mgnify:CR=1 FL=1
MRMLWQYVYFSKAEHCSVVLGHQRHHYQHHHHQHLVWAYQGTQKCVPLPVIWLQPELSKTWSGLGWWKWSAAVPLGQVVLVVVPRADSWMQCPHCSTANSGNHGDHGHCHWPLHRTNGNHNCNCIVIFALLLLLYFTLTDGLFCPLLMMTLLHRVSVEATLKHSSLSFCVTILLSSTTWFLSV